MLADEFSRTRHEFRTDLRYIELGQLVRQTFNSKRANTRITIYELAELCHKTLGLAISTTASYLSYLDTPYYTQYLPPIDKNTPIHPLALDRDTQLYRLAVYLFMLDIDPNNDLINKLRDTYKDGLTYPPIIRKLENVIFIN